ncbi:hypothetical protein COLO4_37401 [Corchorus olitorius]|uniref:FBD domain-containing protein n=1 Tax=Corchorus olitorius TaxID=93759 RepID=A0A1R3G233_9ROSI|nr:hypothetical protein COLO4_37401 [Corchorus olitorius]
MYRKLTELVAKEQHVCLKVIEFIGFVGCSADRELLQYLLKTAISLNKLTLDTSFGYFDGKLMQWDNPKHTQAARSRGKQLETILPPGVELVSNMEEAAKTARESLDLAFHISNILDTGLDRHTLSVLIALCDLGLNPEALAAVVKELQREPSPLPPPPTAPSSLP